MAERSLARRIMPDRRPDFLLGPTGTYTLHLKSDSGQYSIRLRRFDDIHKRLVLPPAGCTEHKQLPVCGSASRR
jgi:hypothetical protein